jgi:hypothetical protein
VALVSWLVVRGTWPEWLLVALAVHFLAHSLGRVPTSVWHGTIQPGLASGLLLCAPLGLATLAKGLRVFSRRELTLGFVVGIASIQPLWHFAMLPWLPSPPTDPSPLRGVPAFPLLPVPDMAQGVRWAFEIPIPSRHRDITAGVGGQKVAISRISRAVPVRCLRD